MGINSLPYFKNNVHSDQLASSSESILFTAYIISPLNSNATPLHYHTGNWKFIHCKKST